MSSGVERDHRAEFINYFGLHTEAKIKNDDSGVARFALQAVNELHLMMPGRNDRATAVRIMHEVIGGPVFGGSEEKTGELYDELRKDAGI